LRISENRVSGEYFDQRKKQQQEGENYTMKELQTLHPIFYITRVIKARNMKQAEDVACIREMKKCIHNSDLQPKERGHTVNLGIDGRI